MSKPSITQTFARSGWKRVALVSLFLLTLFVLSISLSPVDSNVALAQGSTGACDLLDEPAVRGLMSGMFETHLLIQCGRGDELGKGANEPVAPGPSNPQVGVDVMVNATGETGPNTTQSETSLARNEDTGTLCSGFNDGYSGIVLGEGYTGFSRSIDDGATWDDRGHFGGSSFGDPSMFWRRADGLFYIATLHSNGLALYQSTDECQTFQFLSNPSTSGGADKELIAIDNDPASPFYGRFYLAQTDFGAGAQISFTYSDDGISWAGAQLLSGSGIDVQGAWPTVAPNGDLYIGWVRWNPYPSGPIDIEIVRSTDGGETFAFVSNPLTGAVNPRDNAATNFCGRPALNGNIRYLPSPQVAVSPNGDLHVVYSYDPDGFNTGDVVNVYYRRSTDDGATWGPEILLNDDGTTTDQFFPTLSTGPGGRIVTTWYDRRLDEADNYLFDYFMRVSNDGGDSFEDSLRVSDVSSPVYIDPGLASCYHGDYDQQLQDAGYAYIQWSDDRNVTSGHPDPDVWFDKHAFFPDFTLEAEPETLDVCAPEDA
ncbi:MAG: sialidase family protein, partial [Egibacteraceae bacterium]